MRRSEGPSVWIDTLIDDSRRVSRPLGLCGRPSTEEDVPRGQSLQARLVSVELGRDSLDWDLLTACQAAAAEGLYAAALAGFVQWLAPRYGGVVSSLRSEIAGLRQWAAGSRQHRRTPEAVANLALGLRYYIAFALDVGCLSLSKAEKLWRRSWTALGEVAEAQADYQAEEEPAARFVNLVLAAIGSGRAHVACAAGGSPEKAAAWGWRPTGSSLLRPQGERIGWLDGEDLYLDAEVAYACTQKLVRDGGGAINLTVPTLKRRLRDEGLLASVETRGGKVRLEVRRVLEGRRRKVLHLRTGSLSSEKVAQVTHRARDTYTTGCMPPLFGPLKWPIGADDDLRVAPEQGGDGRAVAGWCWACGNGGGCPKWATWATY